MNKIIFLYDIHRENFINLPNYSCNDRKYNITFIAWMSFDIKIFFSGLIKYL